MANENTHLQTREQRLASKVLDKVKAQEMAKQEIKDAYGSMAHRLPILIRTAGLAQALAFVEARGKEGHKQLLKDLSAIVLGNEQIQSGQTLLVSESRTVTLQRYIWLTQQSLDALLWFKRFAQSVLDIDADMGNDREGEE